MKEEINKYFEAKRDQRKEGTEGQAKNSNRGSRPNNKLTQSTNYKKKGNPLEQGHQDLKGEIPRITIRARNVGNPIRGNVGLEI